NTPDSVTSACTASVEVLSHSAKRTAASRCRVWVVTAVEEPPQFPVASSPASHCGRGAICQFPSVDPALPDRTPGAHTAETHPTWVPLFSAVFHCGVYIGALSITPSSTSSPQNRATRCVGSSAIATDQCYPSICHHDAPARCASPTPSPRSVTSASIATDPCAPAVCHHEAPACSTSPTNRAGSALEKARRNISASAPLTVRAPSAESAHVSGADSPSSSKTAAR